MLGDTVKHLRFPKHTGRYGKILLGSQNMLGDTVKRSGFPKHVGRYSKMLGVPKTCREL